MTDTKDETPELPDPIGPGKYGQWGFVRVVDRFALEQATAMGSALIEVLPPHLEVTTPATLGPVQYDNSGRAVYPTPMQTSASYFLVGETRSAVFQRLHQQLKDKTAYVQKLEDASREDAKTLTEVRRDASIAKDDLKRAQDALIRASNEIAAMRTRVQAMEVDLGKVRKEIGEREWARIIPPPAPLPATVTVVGSPVSCGPMGATGATSGAPSTTSYGRP